MLFVTFASLVLAVGTTAISQIKRDTIDSSQQIYAYGTGISGLPIVANSNGVAMVTSDTSSNLTGISWTIDEDGTVPWNATATDNSTSTSASAFYIVNTDDAYSPAGFVSSNTTTPAGAETVGFLLYGTNVAFLDGTTLEMQFWAKVAGTSEWQIYWNVNGSSQADSVPVTLKTTAPTS